MSRLNLVATIVCLIIGVIFHSYPGASIVWMLVPFLMYISVVAIAASDSNTRAWYFWAGIVAVVLFFDEITAIKDYVHAVVWILLASIAFFNSLCKSMRLDEQRSEMFRRKQEEDLRKLSEAKKWTFSGANIVFNETKPR